MEDAEIFARPFVVRACWAELNEKLLEHIEKAIGGLGEENTPFKISDVRLKDEVGVVHFRWMGKNWRVDDRYNVEYHTNMGYITDDSCILMKLLLKKHGAVAEIKRAMELLLKE